MTLTDRAQTPRQTTSVVPVCAAAGFTTLLDSSVLNIGLPALRTGLDAGVSQVQWILAAYSLSFGLALVPAGRLGDVAGRRRLFLAGMTLFAVMGVCGAVASDPWTVVAARAGQGVGAGLISAQVLGILAENYTGPARARALAAYSTAGGLAGLCGPLVGGLVLGAAPGDYGWRVLLILNVPCALVTLVLAARRLPPDRGRPSARSGVDAGGLALLAAATTLVMVPVVSEPGPVGAVFAVGGAAVSLATFLWWERRVAVRGGKPVLLPELTGSGGYILGTLVALFWFGAVLSLNTVVSLYLIEGRGYAAVQAAAVLSAAAAAMAVASAVGWRVVARYGRVTVVVVVAAEIAVVGGYAAAVQHDATMPVFVALAALSGLSGGFVDAPNRALTLESSPAGGHGVAAAFLQLSQRLSATVALAAVSGLYLSALATDGDDFAGAASAGLAVCAAMLAMSLLCALADRRRRAGAGFRSR